MIVIFCVYVFDGEECVDCNVVILGGLYDRFIHLFLGSAMKKKS